MTMSDLKEICKKKCSENNPEELFFPWKTSRIPKKECFFGKTFSGTLFLKYSFTSEISTQLCIFDTHIVPFRENTVSVLRRDFSYFFYSTTKSAIQSKNEQKMCSVFWSQSVSENTCTDWILRQGKNHRTLVDNLSSPLLVKEETTQARP